MSWSLAVEDPIALRGGCQLVTLADAGNYITKPPKAEHEAAEWQAAREALILVATSGGPTMFARIGVMRALSRLVAREFDTAREDTRWESESWRGIGDRWINPTADPSQTDRGQHPLLALPDVP
jgi:hypothetical protein